MKGLQMTSVQVTAMREMWEEATSVVREKYTAREFALMPHSLMRDSRFARTPDGKTFIWDERFEQWSRWK